MYDTCVILEGSPRKKTHLKQNAFLTEKKRTDRGYDPTQKYRLVWDVMTHNMNQLIDKGGLDLTMYETT